MLKVSGDPPRMGSKFSCPSCGHDESGVKDSRPYKDGSSVRRRCCMSCGHRFTTFEIVGDSVPKIDVKRLKVLLAATENIARELRDAIVVAEGGSLDPDDTLDLEDFVARPPGDVQP